MIRSLWFLWGGGGGGGGGLSTALSFDVSSHMGECYELSFNGAGTLTVSQLIILV